MCVYTVNIYIYIYIIYTIANEGVDTEWRQPVHPSVSLSTTIGLEHPQFKKSDELMFLSMFFIGIPIFFGGQQASKSFRNCWNSLLKLDWPSGTLVHMETPSMTSNNKAPAKRLAAILVTTWNPIWGKGTGHISKNMRKWIAWFHYPYYLRYIKSFKMYFTIFHNIILITHYILDSFWCFKSTYHSG